MTTAVDKIKYNEETAIAYSHDCIHLTFRRHSFQILPRTVAILPFPSPISAASASGIHIAVDANLLQSCLLVPCLTFEDIYGVAVSASSCIGY